MDHVVPVRVAPDRRLDPTNLRTLCAPCHARKTAREDGGFGNARPDAPGRTRGEGGKISGRSAANTVRGYDFLRPRNGAGGCP